MRPAATIGAWHEQAVPPAATATALAATGSACRRMNFRARYDKESPVAITGCPWVLGASGTSVSSRMSSQGKRLLRTRPVIDTDPFRS